MLRSSHRAVAAALTAAALLAACGGDDNATTGEPASTTGTTAAETPTPGGTLSFALAIDPTCLDPQQTGLNASLNIGRQLVDSLTDQDPETGKITPWLAQSWEVSPDATSYTFKLQPGATFSDGAPLDADAVKTNLDQIVALGAKAPLGSSYLGGYAGATVVDPTTIKVDFKAPSAQFLQATSTMSLGFLSPASFGQTPEARCQGNFAGSGPFVFKSYTPAQNVVITKRAGYSWGSPVFGHAGEAYLDAIDYKIIPESGVRLGSLTSGQVDGITDLQPQDESQVGDPYTILTRANPGLPFILHPNASRPLLGDVSVRRALVKGADRVEVAATVLSDKWKPASSALASETPDYVDHSTDLAYDPDGAKALLEGAGWTVGSDGIRTKGGQKLSLDVIFAPAFNGNQAVLELVQQQFKLIGVDLQLRQLTVAESNTVLASGDYDLVLYNLTRADPDVLRTIFSTKFTNRTHLPPNPLDDVLDAQAATSDPAKRADLVAQAQQIILDNAYAVPIFELSQVHALSPEVKGLRFEASSRLSFFDTWLKS